MSYVISHLLRRLLRHTDIPAPELIGLGGQELGRLVDGVPPLSAALPHFALGGEDAIHGALGAEVDAFIEQRGVDLGRCEVHEARLMEHVEHALALRRRERAWG